MGFRGSQANAKTKIQSKKITTWRLQSSQNMQQLLICYLGSRILGSSALLLNLRVNFWRAFIKPESLSSWVSLIPCLMLLSLLQNYRIWILEMWWCSVEHINGRPLSKRRSCIFSLLAA